MTCKKGVQSKAGTRRKAQPFVPFLIIITTNIGINYKGTVVDNGQRHAWQSSTKAQGITRTTKKKDVQVRNRSTERVLLLLDGEKQNGKANEIDLKWLLF